MGKGNRIFYGWWIVAATFGMWFTGAASPFAIILKQLMVEFNIGRGPISFLPTIFSIAGGITALFVGRLLKNRHPQKFILWGSVVGGTVFLLGSVTRDLWQLYVIYTLSGAVLSGAAGGVSVIILLSKWFNRKRGLAVGIALSGMAFGSLVLNPVLAEIAVNFGWRATYVFAGALILLINVPVAIFVLKGTPEERGVLPDGIIPSAAEITTAAKTTTISSEINPKSMGLLAYLKHPGVWLVCLCFLLMSMGSTAIMQHEVSFLTDSGISTTLAASALGFTGGICGIAGLISGWLADRMPRKYVTMIFALITLAGILVLMRADTMPLVWLFVVIFGFGSGAAGIIFPLIIGDIVGPAGFSTVFGFANMAFCLGWALGAPLAGFIFDATNSYTWVFIIAAIFQAVAIPAIYGAYRSRQKI